MPCGICISFKLLLDHKLDRAQNEKFIVDKNLITVVLVINHNTAEAAIQ